MSTEYYDPQVLERSRRLYEQIRPWVWGRSDVTLIGGWAVFELVDPDHALQSRDVDLVMHTMEALTEFNRSMKEWGLVWRRWGRTRFNDCIMRDDPKKEIVVDVLQGNDFRHSFFGGHRMWGVETVKRVKSEGPLPSLEWLINDKLATIPKRTRDAEDKRLKDFIDVHNLVFFNRTGISPRQLHRTARDLDRTSRYLEDARTRDKETYGGAFHEELTRLADWFATKTEGESTG